MTKTIFHLKVELDDKDFKLFKEIQEHYNIKNNTDVVRLAIKDSHRIMLEREKQLSGIAKKQEVD